jgi:hypothetical protein
MSDLARGLAVIFLAFVCYIGVQEVIFWRHK